MLWAVFTPQALNPELQGAYAEDHQRLSSPVTHAVVWGYEAMSVNIKADLLPPLPRVGVEVSDWSPMKGVVLRHTPGGVSDYFCTISGITNIFGVL